MPKTRVKKNSAAGYFCFGLSRESPPPSGVSSPFLLLAPAYRDLATPVMIWVSAGYGVYGLNMTLENRLMSLNQTSLLLPPLALGAIANVGFSLLLVPLNGIVGAAQATCASFIAQCVATGVTLAIYSIRVARDVSSPENSAAAAEVEMEKEALKAADDI
jgi:O-antigen/teichoic acid export membrane protein